MSDHGVLVMIPSGFSLDANLVGAHQWVTERLVHHARVCHARTTTRGLFRAPRQRRAAWPTAAQYGRRTVLAERGHARHDELDCAGVCPPHDFPTSDRADRTVRCPQGSAQVDEGPDLDRVPPQAGRLIMPLVLRVLRVTNLPGHISMYGR
jgi:hypothetical protein